MAVVAKGDKRMMCLCLACLPKLCVVQRTMKKRQLCVCFVVKHTVHKHTVDKQHMVQCMGKVCMFVMCKHTTAHNNVGCVMYVVCKSVD